MQLLSSILRKSHSVSTYIISRLWTCVYRIILTWLIVLKISASVESLKNVSSSLWHETEWTTEIRKFSYFEKEQLRFIDGSGFEDRIGSAVRLREDVELFVLFGRSSEHVVGWHFLVENSSSVDLGGGFTRSKDLV